MACQNFTISLRVYFSGSRLYKFFSIYSRVSCSITRLLNYVNSLLEGKGVQVILLIEG
jgi:hypothetical protein